MPISQAWLLNVNMISLASYNVKWEAGVVLRVSTVEGCNDYVNPVGSQNSQLDSGSWTFNPINSLRVSATGVADTALISIVLNGFSLH
jgi:hypothetical protein